MNRSKIILIVLGAVFLILVGAAGVMTINMSSAAAKARRDRDREFKKLEDVFRDDIFPSATNVAVLKDNVRRLKEARESFARSLAQMNVPMSTNTSASGFMATVQKIVEDKKKNAPVVEGKRSVMQDSKFAFGFERYVGPAARPPQDQEVPRLMQQLVVISTLVDEMYAANVLQIQSIGREVFETGGEAVVEESTGEEEPAGRSRGRRRGSRVSSGGEGGMSSSRALMAPIVSDLYEGQHFVLHFSARQNSLIDLLNRIARLRFTRGNFSKDYFAIVTDVRMRKMGPDVRVPVLPSEKEDEGRRPRRGAANVADVVQDADAAPVLSELPPAQRLMSGPDVDPPLDVTIELDVLNFEKPKSDKEEN